MRGTQRVITFCLLTTVLPAILIISPLYLRNIKYADVMYKVSDSDVIQIHKGQSSIFCSKHSLKMNSTFNAFQMKGRPVLSKKRRHVTLRKSMTLPDDTLEYWGFYLFAGAVVELKACSRYEGSKIMVVRGDKVFNTCGILEGGKNKKDPLQVEKDGHVSVTLQNPKNETENFETLSDDNNDANEDISPIPGDQRQKRDKKKSSKVFKFGKTMDEQKTVSEEIVYIDNDHCREENKKKDSDNEDNFDINEFLRFKKTRDDNRSAKKAYDGENQSSSCSSRNQKKEKYNWQYPDTLALIQSYAYHSDEKDHPIQKKYFWGNIVNDLTSQKFNVTINQCQTKWGSLYHTYKSCKDKSGRSPDTFKFYEEIDEFLGHKPANSSQYAMGSLPKKIYEENKENQEDTNKKTENKKRSGKKKKLCEYNEERLLLKKAKLELAKEKLQVEKEKCELLKKFIELKSKK